LGRDMKKTVQGTGAKTKKTLERSWKKGGGGKNARPRYSQGDYFCTKEPRVPVTMKGRIQGRGTENL